MRKSKKVLKTTSSNRVYNAAMKDIYADCEFCRWHRGCNRGNRHRGETCWKKYRRHQWKNKNRD